jgi:DNA invertase Pin-like site-specific DNA recombinase
MRPTELRKSALSEVEAPKGELIGYARVSTEDQSLALQTDALKKIGCLNIYEEKISGAKRHRPQLDLAIKDLRPGDTLVVWRIDRLSRSMGDFYERLAQIEAAGAGFKSVSESFDFTTATGRLILGIMAVMAQFERQLTIERTRAGMQALKERGHKLGATIKFTADKKRQARALLKKMKWVVLTRKDHAGKPLRARRRVYSKIEIAHKLDISIGTLHNWIRDGMK